jgi:endo-1,4-beta-xylanase
VRRALALVALLAVVQAQPAFLGNIFQGTWDPEFTRYWDQVTPENAGKWGSVEATRGQPLWSSLDLMFAEARRAGIPVKQHTFIWGQQEPRWVAGLPPEEQREAVLSWMRAFAERYPDVEYIDVVNEAQHAPPSYKDAIGGDGETGWDWVIWAFEQARALFPNSKLLINDYNILCCARQRAVYIEQIRLLQARGLIDGIGVQGHGLETVPPEVIRQSLDELAALGLPIYVSELELRARDDWQQLELYRRIFPVIWQHPAVAGVTLWGYRAGQMWRPTAELIDWFDAPRPALQWLMDYLRYDRLIRPLQPPRGAR